MSGPSGAAERLEYIDALRGYALLGVIAVHVSQAVIGFTGPLQALASSGRYGVQLFFVVSGFAMMASWEARRDGVRAFYVRRLFRIAPMFWLAIVAYLGIYGLRPRYWAPDGVSWGDVLSTVAFVHGAAPQTVNSVVPGGWSIAAEMAFYAIFPFVAPCLKSLASTALAFAAAIGVAFWFRAYVGSEGGDYLLESFTYFAFPSQLPAFLIGAAAYRALQECVTPRAAGVACVIGSACCVFGMPLTEDFFGRHFIYAAAFGALVVGLGSGAAKAIANRPMAWLGKVSYGGYLWHFAIIEAAIKVNNAICKLRGDACSVKLMDDNLSFVLMFCAVLAVTAALAAVTYHAIERPMIAKGRRLAQRWQRRAKAAVAATA
ncbi:acyltransferase family protein [Methylosinus sp. LW4]|uniref:acyltransferase family protein n=1 Tax=Methylosinus sp. LW4 TaxID=136993 RepID=UPI0003788E41|nr:acyltransferase [Methylosinus sp. LW4]